ncbi:hypothetical protein [Roseobacter ponti]|uniref:DUF4239 domain-containing protein n=1 Tax=Roseobacter ponti TaxID=1891787 RepID=A0A858SW96_9RHOB|nr:hypothetical protein [Roseobacter ponti]QJF51923.1 hypothetical protein G3256_12475 [Roseobacter ponti]
MSRDLFTALPSWAVFLGTVAIIAMALELGYRFARWKDTGGNTSEAAGTGIATGAILGLVSFLLAFTFGIAASHFDQRKSVVLNEANAIGTAYLRFDFLDPEPRREAIALITEYTEVRLRAATDYIDEAKFNAVVRRSEDIQSRIWDIVVRHAKANPSPNSALLISSVNDIIDIHTERVTRGVRNRIPWAIWASLYLVSSLGVAAAAYRISASSGRRSELLPALTVAFAAVITLISDLDDPRHGFLKSDQAAIESALVSMKSRE